MRRFITFIDAVYESKSLLLILADSDPIKLLQIDDETKKTAAYDEVSHFHFSFSVFFLGYFLVFSVRFLLLIELYQGF
jgi:hypothetical protein